MQEGSNGRSGGRIKKAIDGRRYLLVLDDVWNESSIEWLKLEDLLSGGARGSKILITARAKLVAEVAKSTEIHVLKGLSPEESWLLFKQVAFKGGVEPKSSTIVGIGKEVVKICVGVPLFIKAIGSTLRTKENEVDWLNFKKNDLPRMTQDSEGTVLPILKLSYDYLPARLKRCFVYCAIFPKDYEIPEETLIRMLMAQGIIQLDRSTRSLEEVGEQYLKDLLDRSFLEVCETYDDGRIYSYKMHDLIHDLAQSLGGDEYYSPGLDVNSIDSSTRHAWVLDRNYSTNLLNANKLRTLVVQYSGDVLDEYMVNEITSTSKKIRVLGLAWLNIRAGPDFVGGLRHLSYLDLSHNDFDLLPESICSLYSLQTLILYGCRNLKELPMGTRNLVSLRHLDISHCNKLRHMPRGLEELTCLQTLSRFVTGGGAEGRNCAELGELQSLVNLRGSLQITELRGSKDVKYKREQSCILINLKLIQSLELRWSWDYKVTDEDEDEELLIQIESLKPHPNLENLKIYDYRGERVPSWMDTINVSLPNIVTITLDYCKSWRHLSPFGLLPSLRELKICDMGGTEYLYDDCSDGGSSDCNPNSFHPSQLFPSLKVLDLSRMPKLTRLVGAAATSRLKEDNNSRCFPVLEKLIIKDCPVLVVADWSDEDGKKFLSLREVTLKDIDTVTLPGWLQFLSHLQILELSDCYNIVSLPEWMGNLTSLHEIRLISCRSLASIPDCMRRLTSLQRLEVMGYPKLRRRCEKERGEDWHKIAHIPNVELKKGQ